ncbi:MAG TPA: choice-of-anchor D domain-containing protein [Candidatus Acidoferrum sp.]|nr:choice-of-anchor D domain-containing protein [Candidatus Acidoferrum sp.]
MLKRTLQGAGAPAVRLRTASLFVAFSVLLFALFCFSGCAGVTQQTTSQPSQISVVPSSITFSNVVIGQKSTQTVQISNVGQTNVSVTAITLTGSGFSLSSISVPFQLAPGASQTFTVSFTASSTATAKATLTITSGVPSSPTTVAVQGTGQTASAAWQLNPTALSFGTVALQSTLALPGTVKNTGNASVTISSVSISNPEWSTTGLASGTTLAPGQQLTFAVVFGPTASGNVTGTLQIASSSTSSLTMNLAGTGGTTSTPPPASQHTVTLTWNPSSSVVSGYHIYRGSASGGPYSLLNSVLYQGTSFVDSNVVNGTQYFYVTTAVDASGVESVFSNEASATIPNQ